MADLIERRFAVQAVCMALMFDGDDAERTARLHRRLFPDMDPDETARMAVGGDITVLAPAAARDLVAEAADALDGRYELSTRTWGRVCDLREVQP